MKHGARQASTGLYVRGSSGLQLRDQRVRKLVSRMRVAMHWIEDSDLPVCRQWAEIEVLASRVYAELRDRGVVNAEGEPRRLLSEFRQLRQTQLAFERELGMTPSSRQALRATGARTPIDLAAQLVRTDEED
jgi:hypothetical protein